jgi:hypothetical protein
MDTFNSNNFQLIKKDIGVLKQYIFKDNDINDWSKIIIIYNFYLIFNHLYFIYNFIEYMGKNNHNFILQFRNIYIFFYMLCNLKNSYLYFILNVYKIDKNLADSLYKNTKEYFIF